MKYILVLLLSIGLVQAEMTTLKKGDITPFEGVLSDAAQMKEFRQANEEKKLLELENVKLKDLGVIQDMRIDLYKKEVGTLNKDLSKAENKRFFTNIGYFTLGILLTGVASYAAIRSTK